MLNTENTNLYDELAKGYKEMSVINIEESEAGLAADNEALEVCERNLTESEEDFDCKTR